MRTLPVLLFCAAFAAAQGTNAKLAEIRKQRVIGAFYEHVGTLALDAATRNKVLAFREGATLGGEYGCIHQSLLLLHPDYRRADALLLNERYTAAADVFSRLRQSSDPYLKAYATYRYGVAQMNRDRYEEATEIFAEVLNQYRNRAGCDIEAAFYRVICLGQERDKEKAIVEANNFLKDYPDAPERFKRAMEQIKNELMQEWESPLYELAGRMNKVARRIEGGDTGEKTQGDQKEIVAIIEELIKRAEQQEGQQGQQNQGGNGQPRGNRPPSSPAQQSAAPRGSSRTGNLNARKRKPGSKWGEMRDKEREEVMQALKEKFPERYRALLEQYHKALAEGRRVTETSEDR